MELAIGDKEEEEKRPSCTLIPQMVSEYPWLMISHGEDRQIQTLFNISSNHYYTRLIPEMCGKGVRICSSHGWWVVKDFYSNDYFLLNPISMQKLLLPSLDEDDPDSDYDICLLSAAPDEPNCRVTFFESCSKIAMICEPASDDKFFKQYLELDEYEYLQSAIIFKGKLYCLIGKRHLLSLTTADVASYKEGPSIIKFTKLSMEALPWPSPPETACFQSNLIESNGELLLVHKIYSGELFMTQVLDFRIFQVVADYNADPACQIMSWRELKSIGDERTIFVDRYYGISCAVNRGGGGGGESRVRGNSIYFVEQHDKNLYRFDLENRSVSISLPCPNVRRCSRMSWVMI